MEHMFANQANHASKLSKTLAIALGAFLLMAPGAAAQGALDLSSTTRVAGEAGADASAVNGIADQVVAEVEGVADQAQNAALSTHVNADVQAEAPIKAENAADAGVGFAATMKGYMSGFLQKIKGYFSQTEADTRAEAEMQADLATDSALAAGDEIQGELDGVLQSTQYAASSAQYSAQAEVDANTQAATDAGSELVGEAEGLVGSATQSAAAAQYAAQADVTMDANAVSGVSAPRIPQPQTPSGFAGLTASLQAALTGLVQLGGFGDF